MAPAPAPAPAQYGSTAWWMPTSPAREVAAGGVGIEPAERNLSLTRRGRLVLVGLPIALCVAALILLGAFLSSQAHAGEAAPVPTETLEVGVAAGETLWDLALYYAPERDPRDVVVEMVELNNLGSSVLQAGQRIAVPTAG